MPVLIEPDDRLVVLARTIHAPEPALEQALKADALNSDRFGEACLGQTLYRHRTVYQNTSDAPVWSHMALSYFRNIVPADAIAELVEKPQPAGAGLLRAEILLTTPCSFILPRDWQGSTDRPHWNVSLEFIDVHPPHLDAYRKAMQKFCGPAAARLVRATRFGTFRAMETAAVLHHNPELKIGWNQIHLCELDPSGFDGFGPAFEAALREDPPNGAEFEGAFAGLARMRTVPRWTFNDAVVEADTAVARLKN